MSAPAVDDEPGVGAVVQDVKRLTACTCGLADGDDACEHTEAADAIRSAVAPPPAAEPREDAVEALARVNTPDDLFDHLDGLNQAGHSPETVGFTRHGQPFLAFLQGPDADAVGVLLGNPWDCDADFGTGLRCEECNAKNNAEPETLAYPLTLVSPSAIGRGAVPGYGPTGDRAGER